MRFELHNFSFGSNSTVLFLQFCFFTVSFIQSVEHATIARTRNQRMVWRNWFDVDTKLSNWM